MVRDPQPVQHGLCLAFQVPDLVMIPAPVFPEDAFQDRFSLLKHRILGKIADIQVPPADNGPRIRLLQACHQL